LGGNEKLRMIAGWGGTPAHIVGVARGRREPVEVGGALGRCWFPQVDP
jgi:hypothetical protein